MRTFLFAAVLSLGFSALAICTETKTNPEIAKAAVKTLISLATFNASTPQK